VKRCLAIALLLMSAQVAAALLGSQSAAIECGPAMRAATIDQMKLAVREANAKVLPHVGALTRELRSQRQAAATDAAIAEIDKSAQELGSLVIVMQAGNGTYNALESASLLAAIREQMVYGGDKSAANARLSDRLYAARQEAEKAYQYISPALPRFTSPGVAADVAKLRDAIEGVLKVLGNCKPPAKETPRE
jgi:hypothetical protein